MLSVVSISSAAIYRQSSLYRQSSVIRDANSEHAFTDLRLFLYVKERTEVTILSWGKGGKDLTYTPKIVGLLPYFVTNFSARYNFSASNLNRLRPHIKNIFTFLVMVKKRTSPIWETSSLLYFDSFCSNEIIQRLELQLLQLLRQEPQFQQQPS